MELIFGEGVSIEDTEFIAGSLLVAGLFGFWEIWRRTRPTSLVLIGGHLGVYRKGQLHEIAGFGQLTHHRLIVINTLGECIFFGLFALGGGGFWPIA